MKVMERLRVESNNGKKTDRPFTIGSLSFGAGNRQSNPKLHKDQTSSILKVKQLSETKDNRRINHKRIKRHELSKKFKATESLRNIKPASLNLNIWMLTSKRKKKILFNSANKDLYDCKAATKSRFTSKDFVFKTPNNESTKLY